jgi:hypothetical protein
MHAVVMAAGEGSRLRPLTEQWPKPILPIDGRPVIATLLRELAAARCSAVTVVTGHLAEQVEELLGDGSGFDLDLRSPKRRARLLPTPFRAVADAAEPPARERGGCRPPATFAASSSALDGSGAAGALAVRRDDPRADAAHRPRAHAGGPSSGWSRRPGNRLGAAPLWVLDRHSCRS